MESTFEFLLTIQRKITVSRNHFGCLFVSGLLKRFFNFLTLVLFYNVGASISYSNVLAYFKDFMLEVFEFVFQNI
jgi:hypothetical protein